MHPGPGVDGPGPGVSAYQPTQPLPPQPSQVLFVGPEGMTVTWDISMPGSFDSEPLICPGRYNFPQGAIYRLKLANVPGRAGVELYPTLEVGVSMPRTQAFVAHSAIPVQFTEEDFDQVISGNFVTKVIYLPDPEFQELALAGVETLVSTRLDPGVDPIVEADNRGSILAIVRLGNKDFQIPGEVMQPGGVVPASAMMPVGPGSGGSMAPANYISGVTGPQYGMPMCGTPIGLPGPPHVPMGAPAGLHRHKMVNKTKVKIPQPTHKLHIAVKQKPGFVYPKQPKHARIVEKNRGPLAFFRQPFDKKHQLLDPGATGEGVPCENGVPSENGGVPYDNGVPYEQ